MSLSYTHKEKHIYIVRNIQGQPYTVQKHKHKFVVGCPKHFMAQSILNMLQLQLVSVTDFGLTPTFAYEPKVEKIIYTNDTKLSFQPQSTPDIYQTYYINQLAEDEFYKLVSNDQGVMIVHGMNIEQEMLTTFECRSMYGWLARE